MDNDYMLIEFEWFFSGVKKDKSPSVYFRTAM